MSCHSCDITALGCSGCDANHFGLTTHGPLHLGLGTPVVSSKTVLNEFALHLSAALLAENSPYKVKIEESLAKGTLSRFSRCLLSAAIQAFAMETSQELGPEILLTLEKKLLEDEAAKAKARKAAEDAARERAGIVAKEAADAMAKMIATTIAQQLAPKAAREAAIEPAKQAAKEAAIEPARHTATQVARDIATAEVKTAVQAIQAKQDLDNFTKRNLAGFTNISQDEVREAIAKASANAPAVTDKFKIPQESASQVPRLALYDFLFLCGVEDDSSSMTTEATRIPTLEASIRGLFRIRTDLGSKRRFSIIPFEGTVHENLNTGSDLDRALKSLKYNTGASALGPLEKRILGRLGQDAGKKTLYPTVVVVITDGDVSSNQSSSFISSPVSPITFLGLPRIIAWPKHSANSLNQVGNVSSFGQAIASFKNLLNKNNYLGPAALFLICRVGGDNTAAASLMGLKHNKAIKDMVLYSEDQLDSKLSQMQGNIDEYAGWVVGELLKAMELQVLAA
ncbi:hypothetical protein GP486_000357 [Trichoglossum hirsutum]|uniref:VWFA domain-containing protein n=1 Tax=Trichoglossum hirsutum TaxID=265104 RepID=A0A9P8RTQ3_9PEZI|nr:hypothetical protein GP486_000357 [Trichoglossum hirsutum]